MASYDQKHTFLIVNILDDHQTTSSDSAAQIGTTTNYMNKLMSLKITDFPTRYEFLISFQDLCTRYNHLATTPLDNSFRTTLLQRLLVIHDTALLNMDNLASPS